MWMCCAASAAAEAAVGGGDDEADPEKVGMLEGMGFSEAHAKAALKVRAV